MTTKKDNPILHPTIRDTLFADESLERVATLSSEPGDTSVWARFANAQQHLQKGDRNRAIQELTETLEIKGLESRVYLQAWLCLGALGVFPPTEIANQIRGVVVEVALEQGVDLVACYADYSARYYNFSSAGVVWDAADAEIEKLIDGLLRAGQEIISQIGLWENPRPPPPPTGFARINLLTFGGLYLGEGEFQVLANDKLGGPTLKLAFALMQKLVAKTAVQKMSPSKSF